MKILKHQAGRARAVVAASLLALASPALAAGPTAQEAQDRVAIAETLARYYYAFDTADPDAYAKVFTPDAQFITNGQVRQSGREALRNSVKGIREWLKMPADQRFQDTRHASYTFFVDFESRDRAVAKSYYATLFANPAGGAWQVRDTGYEENTMVKVDGNWLIAKRELFSDSKEPWRPPVGN